MHVLGCPENKINSYSHNTGMYKNHIINKILQKIPNNDVIISFLSFSKRKIIMETKNAMGIIKLK